MREADRCDFWINQAARRHLNLVHVMFRQLGKVLRSSANKKKESVYQNYINTELEYNVISQSQ
jgi:hypothetical protein